MDEAKGRAAAERTFAILTARYHDLPELHALVDELTLEEARDVILGLAAYTKGALIQAEVMGRAPRGSALPRLVEMTRARLPWLNDG